MTEVDLISDGPIRPFTSGWALMPFKGNRAHWWREIQTRNVDGVPDAAIGDGGRVRLYRSSCGLMAEADYKRPAFSPGNWPKCKRCSSLHNREQPGR